MKKTILLLTLILNLIIAENYSLRFTQGNYARLPQITSLQNATEITMEIEGVEKPAYVAETLTMFIT